MRDPTHRCSIVACARWEEESVVEWLEYHRSIGFDHVYLYVNDDDPSVLRRLTLPFTDGAAPFLTITDFPAVGQQRAMYEHFLNTAKQETEWFCFLDLDEFIVLPSHGNLSAFMENLCDRHDSILLNWVLFGHAGFATRPTGSVLLQYCCHCSFADPLTKAITRSSAIDIAALPALRQARPQFWHAWDPLILPQLRVANVFGENAANYTSDWPHVATATVRQDEYLARILRAGFVAHFIFKSEADFVRRCQRSLSGEFASQERWADIFAAGEHLAILKQLNAQYYPYIHKYWNKFIESGAMTIQPSRSAHGLIPSSDTR
jgi:hypothetical protein